MADGSESSLVPAVACPRCKQSPAERKRDHKTKHAVGCPAARGARQVKFRDVAALVAESPTGRESAKRITQQVRSGLMSVFERMGGERALLEWAQGNPSTFFQMWSRAVPRESESASRASGITVNVLGAAEIRQRRRVIDVSPAESVS